MGRIGNRDVPFFMLEDAFADSSSMSVTTTPRIDARRLLTLVPDDGLFAGELR